MATALLYRGIKSVHWNSPLGSSAKLKFGQKNKFHASKNLKYSKLKPISHCLTNFSLQTEEKLPAEL